MTNPRPAPVGRYELLQDFVSPVASVRIIRMSGTGNEVELHVHRWSAQVYVGIEGRAGIQLNGQEHTIGPNEVLAVPANSVHGARPLTPTAVVMNISVPPLAADDQVAVAETSPG